MGAETIKIGTVTFTSNSETEPWTSSTYLGPSGSGNFDYIFDDPRGYVIKGGSSSNQDVWGTLTGTFTVKSTNVSFIAGEAVMSESVATVSSSTYINNEGGTITIQGSSSADANGFWYLRGYLNNKDGNVRIISGTQASAIDYLYAALNNKETLNLVGNEDYAAVNQLYGSVDNFGTVYLNKYAINSFNSGSKFTNRTDATVNAEAEAIFTAGSVSNTKTPIPITVYSGENTSQVTVTGYASQKKTAGSWTLKSGWSNYSTWEAGSYLVFTDVADGPEFPENPDS